MDRAHKARFEIAQVLADLGHTGSVQLPDISTKAKAQQYIGLDIDQERGDKDNFQKTVVPQWLEKAKTNSRLFSSK